MIGEADHLHPGGQFHGQLYDRAPDPVLVQVVQREVAQSGVLGAADAVLGAGASSFFLTPHSRMTGKAT